jgi:hypothetical protein
VLPLRVRASLFALQAIAAATLLRSIAYDRWITVLASVLLIIGAMAAQRGRAWGIGLTFATAVAFPVAFAIGIAPAWFCLVGLAGALPFALTLRPFARFDKGATALLAVLTAAGGTAVAMAWKEMAWTIFQAIPSLRPSMDAQHGVALAATLAVVVAAVATQNRRSSPAETHLRIGERVRVSEDEGPELVGVLDEAHDADDADRPAQRRVL